MPLSVISTAEVFGMLPPRLLRVPIVDILSLAMCLDIENVRNKVIISMTAKISTKTIV